MARNQKWFHGVAGLTLAAVVLMPAASTAQTAAKPPAIKRVAAPNTPANDGEKMFKTYCASCHGLAGKGDGPAAPALKNKPTDLTALARAHGGTMSQKDFEDKLGGSAMSPAHGNSEMPVWGSIFRDLGNDKLRVFNLRTYVEALQVK